MRITRLPILLLSLKEPIIASAQLVERQPQEVWPDPGAAFWSGVTFLGGVGAAIGNLFLDSQDADSSKTIPPPDTVTEPAEQTPPGSPNAAPISQPSSATSSPAEPVYKININNDQPDTVPNLPGVLPSVNQDCDNDADCGATTDQLVFTSSCVGVKPNQAASVEAKAQNQAIQETLNDMNRQNIGANIGGLGLRRSISDICDVYFWALPLTKGQIQKVEKMPNVDMVRPNRDLHMDSGSPDLGNSDPAEEPMLTAPISQLKERDRMVADRSAWEDLRFISTPPNTPPRLKISDAYFYYAAAGEEVINIMVDTGLNILHDEFRTANGDSSLLENRIYAMDTLTVPEGGDNTGTCRSSKIVGRTCGVARKAKVMIAKVSLRLSSMIDVLVQIANYLLNKLLNGEKVGGYHVMSIMIQWDNDDQKVTNRFEEILNLLIRDLKLVVVVPAGVDDGERNADVNMWPATAESRHDIIVVGGAEIRTGKTYPFSRGGPFVTVNAPGSVKCARGIARSGHLYKLGTDVAAAQVAGVISLLLSSDDSGPYLRRYPDILPYRVKSYVKFVASYKRPNGDFPAIWNLVRS